MANYASLKAELANAEYAGLSDADAAIHYNAKTITSVQPIPRDVFAKYLFDSGMYAVLLARTADTDPTHAVARGVALTILDDVKFVQLSSVDTSTQSFQTGLAALTALNDVNSQNISDLTSMATVVTPYYSQPGQFGFPVSADDVHYARSL